MGLQPLEFADCLADSPYFREKLHEHERELESTSKGIKSLISHGKQVFDAAKNLSRAQKTFAEDLKNFNFECIGSQQTDDERVIAQSLKEFGRLLFSIEEEREKLLETATDQFLKPLENFRKEKIGQVKEGKKMFDKQTTKYCQSLERYLNMKTKVNESILQEADASLEMERRGFYQASMKYVLQLQEVQEKKKFEFVEILLTFMYSWLTFYHQGHEAAGEFKPYMLDLQMRLQKTRGNFESTSNQAEELMNKMLEVRGTTNDQHAYSDRKTSVTSSNGCLRSSRKRPIESSGTMRGFTRQGYLYLLEKKALGTTWTKFYCQYKKETKEFYMILYNQMGGKMSTPDRYVLDSCVRRASDSIEKRFCFDLTVKEKNVTMTFQCLSEEDRKAWMSAMDGKEPVYHAPKARNEEAFLDDVGFTFVKRCLASVEKRGLQEQGLYRVVGVNSKVNRLIQMGLDRRKTDKIQLDEPTAWETKTITSAVKNYLRSLPEPLMSFKLHEEFIKAAKQESKTLRILDIHKLVHQLPESNFEMLDLLLTHLQRVSNEHERNKMTVANLGVCFGPTLMRPEEETMAAIMDIKFCNIIVEILINNYDKIFHNAPEDCVDLCNVRVLPKHNQAMSNHSGNKSPRSPAAVMSASSNPVLTQDSGGTGGGIGGVGGGSTGGTPSHIYANQAPVHPSRTSRFIRPTQVFNHQTGVPDYNSYNYYTRYLNNRYYYRDCSPGFETHSSTSSSSDSLNSSRVMSQQLPQNRAGPQNPSQSPRLDHVEHPRRGSNSTYANVSVHELANRFSIAGSDIPTFGSVKKRRSNDFSTSMNSSMPASMTGSLSSNSSSSSRAPGRTVRTLYECQAENDSELSFSANTLIYNVRPSKEPHWLEGTLDGRSGLLPENYVEFIDP
ncbi:rho GTPase-activating protein 26-like isoform X4 [Haliotis rufescens]|uniref:rho GTPase-activating protein 26-like isoform X4 n=1 Tax=Haliotis rufescens TaxID=6454 RepID=UPI00201F80FE|nr:rho GTPase-activating protein 26-like isoform X4 [Haliotis rufescens]